MRFPKRLAMMSLYVIVASSAKPVSTPASVHQATADQNPAPKWATCCPLVIKQGHATPPMHDWLVV